MNDQTRWTETEIEYLKQHYPRGSITEISEVLNRSTNSIRLKASRLKIPRAWPGGDYTVLRCFGKDFDEICIIRCRVFEACLEKYLEAIKTDGSILLSPRKLTVQDKVDRDQLFRALKVLKEIYPE